VNDDPATRLLSRLSAFAQGLDDEERALLAALLAPGLAKAWQDEEDVTGFGFGSVTWLPERLPDLLQRAVREQGLNVQGW
jgi:hypothetical protein